MAIAAAVLPTPAAVQLRVLLPEDVVREYQALADKLQIDIEVLLASRLTSCTDYIAAKPLYFDDDQRQELEQILGRNVLHTKDALQQVRIALTVRIHNLKIQLKPNLLMRLKTRCLGMVWEKFIEQIVTQALERYAGMR